MLKSTNKINQANRAIETLEKVGIEESLIQPLKDAVKGWEKEQEQIIKGHTIKYYGLGIAKFDFLGSKYVATLYGCGLGIKHIRGNSPKEIKDKVMAMDLGKYKSNGYKTYQGAAKQEEWFKQHKPSSAPYIYEVIEILANVY